MVDFKTVIAVSSARPHGKSAEYAVNQMAAHITWEQVFDRIYYFGEQEADLSGPTTRFIGTTGWPSIMDMLFFMGQQRQMAAILNADIVVHEKLKVVATQMEARNINAATSRRWQQVSGEDEPRVIDKGLDIFIARPWLWRSLAKKIPSAYRIGHCEWDTWVLGQLMRETHWKMADFTESRCIFHPVHEGRDMPHNAEVPRMPEEQYDYAKLPGTKIRI